MTANSIGHISERALGSKEMGLMAIDANNDPTISVIIPVYLGALVLEELISRLLATFAKMKCSYEVLLIDDDSPDNSWELIVEQALSNRAVRGFRFSRNFGQHYGITAGLDACTGRWAVIMDCDLQDRPEDIETLYNKAIEGHDIVLARRIGRQHSVPKRFASWCFYRIFSYLIDAPYDGEVGNFRIISARVAKNYIRMRENLRFFGAQIQWLGFQSVTVDIVHAKRAAGESSYTWKKLITLASSAVIAYSDKPLRIAIRLGFLISTFAFITVVWALMRGLLYDVPVLGWTSLIASIYLLGGLNIALLGIVGVYIGKTFDETKKRPLYIIKETTDSSTTGFPS